MTDLGSATPSARRRSKAKPYTNGKPDPSQELLQALQAMRSGDFSVRMTGNHLGIDGKIADTFNRKSAIVIEEGRRTLLDISQSAVKVTRKFDPQAGEGENPPPPRRPNPKRQ